MAVVLRDASLVYGSASIASARPALDRVSLTIRAGAFVAVTGPVGSGKSSLAKALLGLYPLAAGEITLDAGPPARQSEAIGYLSQESFLFSGTIRENVAMGSALDESALAHALDVAALAPDLAGFAQGVDTEIGERGVRVSGGQRQRIALARAVATRPRLLLLDDPFSAVDVGTESQIIASLRAAFGAGAPPGQQASIVLCSHRLAAFPQADLVVLMDQGRVAEQGSHAALMQRGGLYARIYAAQVALSAPSRT